MTSNVVISAIVILLALAVIAVVVARRRTLSDAAPLADRDAPAPWLDDEFEAQVVERDPPVRWADSLGSEPGTLNDESRLRLIKDLGLIQASWVVPLLTQAYVEERHPSHRQAALHALAACQDAEARSALEAAANSSDKDERDIANIALRST